MARSALPDLHTIKDAVRRQRAFVFRAWMKVTSRRFSSSDEPALIVAPHPDDEVLGCGGLIALKLMHGADVSVVFVTAGEAAHDTCCAAARDGIAARRQRLPEKALSELCTPPPAVSWLGLPDGRVPMPEEEGFEPMVRRMVRAIDASGASEVFAPHYHDNHRDHRAVALATIAAARSVARRCALYFYCVWSLHVFPQRPLLPMFQERPLALDIEAVRARKARAVSAYFSETVEGCGAPVSGNLPRGLLARCVGREEFYFPAASGQAVP